MSRGVEYRAGMLDDPNDYEDDDPVADVDALLDDADDNIDTYRVRIQERPQSLPPVESRHLPPDKRSSSVGDSNRPLFANTRRPGQQKKSLDLSLKAAATGSKRKSRHRDEQMVELREMKRSSSRREQAADPRRDLDDGDDNNQVRRRSSTKKRQRSMERRNSATRLLDAVVLDKDYYAGGDEERSAVERRASMHSTDSARAPSKKNLKSRPKSAPLRRSSTGSEPVDEPDGDNYARDESLLQSYEIDKVLAVLRDKEEKIADLEAKLRESDLAQQQPPPQSPGSKAGGELPVQRHLSNFSGVAGPTLSSPLKYPKPTQVAQLLMRIVQSAQSPLRHCALSRQAAVVECMYLTELPAGGDLEAHFPTDLQSSWRLCAVEKGELELRRGDTAEIVRRGAVLVLPVAPDSWLACRTPVQLWSVDSVTLNELQRCEALLRGRENLSFLSGMVQFQQVPEGHVRQLLQALDERVYDDGDDLQLRGTDTADNLVHIVQHGEVRCTDRSARTSAFYSCGEVVVPTIETVNTCRVRAVGDVVCAVVEWKTWRQATEVAPDSPMASPGGSAGGTSLSAAHRPLGFVTARAHRNAAVSTPAFRRDRPSVALRPSSQGDGGGGHFAASGDAAELGINVKQLCLGDLGVVGSLGAGAFGRVELVCLHERPQCVYALKRLSRQGLSQHQQEDQALREKEVLTIVAQDRCRHVVHLRRTFRDHEYVYFLLEAQLGGDLFALCRRRGSPLADAHARFYVACVLEALDYLHSCNIVYRGLKPEDVLLDRLGYAKLSDFGHSKILEQGATHTQSFCGSAEYMAPEQVLEEDHGMPVDVWSVGVITYELLCGTTPFANDNLQLVYSAILKGLDPLNLPKRMKPKAVGFVTALCRFEPPERTGCDGPRTTFDLIRMLPWMKSFRWDQLRRRTMPAPFKPTLNDPHDMRYFESVRPESCTVSSGTYKNSGGWDAGF